MACKLVCSRHGLCYGKPKPPKHNILPFAIKSLTENVELIHTLNRLGHCVSYFQLVLVTVYPTHSSKSLTQPSVYKKLLLSEGDGPLPANIHPGVFTTLAWDNIDRHEETIRVNGIAVQTKLVDLQQSTVLPPVDYTMKRSIITPPLMLPMYNVGQTDGPPQATSVDNHSTHVRTRRYANQQQDWL